MTYRVIAILLLLCSALHGAVTGYKTSFTAEQGYVDGDLGTHKDWQAPQDGAFLVDTAAQTVTMHSTSHSQAQLQCNIPFVPHVACIVRMQFKLTMADDEFQPGNNFFKFSFTTKTGQKVNCRLNRIDRETFRLRLQLNHDDQARAFSKEFTAHNLGLKKRGGMLVSDLLELDFRILKQNENNRCRIDVTLANPHWASVLDECWEVSTRLNATVDSALYNAEQLLFQINTVKSRNTQTLSIERLMLQTDQAPPIKPVVNLGTFQPFFNHRPLPNAPNQENYLRKKEMKQRQLAFLRDPELDFPLLQSDTRRDRFGSDLTLVRILGGFGAGENRFDNDLVYRDKNGKLQYRWHLLKKRLDGFAANGDAVTIVLDDIPAAFPEEIAMAYVHSQAAVPADFNEWEAFIRAMFQEIKRLYPDSVTANWRVRVGTEMHGPRFQGTMQQYCQYYDHAAKAIKEVFPDMPVGPFNGHCGVYQDDLEINVFRLAKHIADGKNAAGEPTPSRFDFASISFYNRTNFEANAMMIGRHFDKVERILGHSVSREIHEFDLLNWRGGSRGSGSGIAGALWFYFYITEFLEHADIDRLYHWSLTSHLPGVQAPILKGRGWTLTTLNHAAGKNLYILNQVVPSNRMNSQFKAALFAGEKRSYLFVGAWNFSDPPGSADTDLTITIPSDILPLNQPKIMHAALNGQNCPHDMIMAELAKNGGDADHTSPEYEHLMKENWTHYSETMRDSLTLKPGGARGRMQRDGQSISVVLKVPIRPPELKIIVIDNAQTENR